jgi:hypothetical protein
MDAIKIGGFLVSFATALLLGLQIYNSFTDGQAKIIAELKGINASMGAMDRRLARVEDRVFPVVQSPGRTVPQ